MISLFLYGCDNGFKTSGAFYLKFYNEFSRATCWYQIWFIHLNSVILIMHNYEHKRLFYFIINLSIRLEKNPVYIYISICVTIYFYLYIHVHVCKINFVQKYPLCFFYVIYIFLTMPSISFLQKKNAGNYSTCIHTYTSLL